MKLQKGHGIAITLDGRYDGVEFTLVDDPPMGVFEDLVTKDFSLIRAALAAVSIGTNLVADDETPIDVTSAEGWKKIPLGAITRLIELYGEKLSPPKAPSTASTTSSPMATPSTSPATSA